MAPRPRAAREAARDARYLGEDVARASPRVAPPCRVQGDRQMGRDGVSSWDRGGRTLRHLDCMPVRVAFGFPSYRVTATLGVAVAEMRYIMGMTMMIEMTSARSPSLAPRILSGRGAPPCAPLLRQSVPNPILTYYGLVPISPRIL